MSTDIIEKKDIVLEDNELVCILTDEVKKIRAQETNLQSVILMLNEEYGFDLEDMERDFSIEYIDPDTGNKRKQKVELVIFDKGKPHEQDHIIRICIIQPDNVKETDNKKGLGATLENSMGAVESCEFGLWANGQNYFFLQKEDDALGFDYEFTDLSDFPGEGESIEDLEIGRASCRERV